MRDEGGGVGLVNDTRESKVNGVDWESSCGWDGLRCLLRSRKVENERGQRVRCHSSKRAMLCSHPLNFDLYSLGKGGKGGLRRRQPIREFYEREAAAGQERVGANWATFHRRHPVERRRSEWLCE
jgi:hypothetical protein